jgi:hypothetical protein
MRALFFVGLAVLILGIVSLILPIPHNERSGIAVGGVSLGVETHHEEKVHPALSGLMIVAGLGVMAAGRRN